jgi:hypothetical protein
VTSHRYEAGSAPERSARRVYGYIYELILTGQGDGEHSYVGMCTTTIYKRVHGPSGHTSPESVTKDPWKAGILSGRAGYRKLEIVYDTGDPGENNRALRRAEAFWIDRLRPAQNDVRPVRPPVRPGERVKPAPRRPAQRVARRRPTARQLGFLVLFAFWTWLAARLIVSMQLPWPAAPWVAAPMAGTFLGWTTLSGLHKRTRWLARRR